MIGRPQKSQNAFPFEVMTWATKDCSTLEKISIGAINLLMTGTGTRQPTYLLIASKFHLF